VSRARLAALGVIVLCASIAVQAWPAAEAHAQQPGADRVYRLGLLSQGQPPKAYIEGLSEAGGLMSYGADVAELWRRGAVYVDKILKGARPGDLPVEQPSAFELTINKRTARAMGVIIPQPLMLRASAIVE
jgi:putative tryptophan/tyrosine transport system substrate-binding protein